jgi:hypothetical protein
MAPRESSSPAAIPAILRYSIAVLSVAIATGAALVLTRFSATLTPFLFAVQQPFGMRGRAASSPSSFGPESRFVLCNLFYSFSFRHADLVYLAIAQCSHWSSADRRRAPTGRGRTSSRPRRARR